MSTPENTRPTSALQRQTRAELTTCDRHPAPTRTDQAVTWVGWHIAELAAIGLPLLLAAWVSWWWVAVSVLAGAAWIAHEVVTTRRNSTTDTDNDTAEAARPLRAVPATRDRSDSGEGIA